MPYRQSLGLVYDSGDYAAALDRAVALADWAGFEARRAEARGAAATAASASPTTSS